MTLRPIIPMFSQPKPAGNLFKQVKIKARPLSIKIITILISNTALIAVNKNKQGIKINERNGIATKFMTKPATLTPLKK